MVAFATFIVISYYPEAVYDVDYGIFQTMQGVLRYWYNPGFQLCDVAISITW